MKPINETTLIVTPKSHIVASTPMIAKGTENIITKGWRRLSNCEAITR